MKVGYMSLEHFMPEYEPESATEEGYENPDVEQPKKKVCSVSTLTWHSCELIHHLMQSRRLCAISTNMLVERNYTKLLLFEAV